MICLPRFTGMPAVLFSVLAIVSLGCGSADTLPPMAPVKGKVVIDGAPLTTGQVALHPQTVDPAVKVPLSAGTIDGSGNFEIFTGGKAGAPLGKYKVVVTPSMVPMQGGGAPPVQVNQKFRLPADTTLSFEVTQAAKEGQYDLQVTK
jgi:hypothetical protein